ncbi:hypothetical protein EDD17DRAFT_527056 [Pisolithus thermaeus]|nr:hypothetical protein EDD17DRAFT_527056 [Pisolithus thermaeus]
MTGVIADVLITGSVYYYLRPSRSGVKRTQTAIQHVVTVTINMGALTSIIALWLWISWVTQGPNPRVSTPLVITSHICEFHPCSGPGATELAQPRQTIYFWTYKPVHTRISE